MSATRFRLRVRPRVQECTVQVGVSGPGLLAAVLRHEPRRWAVVTDTRVRRALWERTAPVLRRQRIEVGAPLLLPAGERAKTLRTLERLLEQLLRRGFDRGSGLVALGGGAVTDLVGFAAATYMRGIDWVAVPTTLLGMVDAGLGGKVATNLLRTKNAVGAFH
ncbi:MAG TPA: iron-containing alcohol dehydrogenase, partial [Candidatus Krumholzibacteria bacterium]|nr:iron-containing alcohol dehydrogenase [Candidatus Krumholzibacteria bacterium]